MRGVPWNVGDAGRDRMLCGCGAEREEGRPRRAKARGDKAAKYSLHNSSGALIFHV